MGSDAPTPAGYNAVAQGAYLDNALGQQVHRTVWTSGSPAVTLSVHDLNGNRIAEYDGSGTLLREYLWLDGRPLAVIEDGNTYWLHWDHILRPVMATDAAGAVVWAVRYLPFGGIDEVMADTGVLTQNLRFPGQWFQAETGLHQNWMRDYDPTTGRYLQADPLGLVDGASVYGYARQGPVRYIDPWGLDTEVLTFPDIPDTNPLPDLPPALLWCTRVLGAAGGAISIILTPSPAGVGSTCDDRCGNMVLNEGQTNEKGGGKDDPKKKKNQDNIKDELDAALAELDKIKSAPNKTPELKEAIKQLQKKVKHLKGKLKGSEPHGINPERR